MATNNTVGKLEKEMEAKSNPQKIYDMIKYTLHHLHTISPEFYKSIDILEGDGESVGSVRLWKYVLPGTSKVMTAKEKTEVVDDENMLIVWNIFEGDHSNHFNGFVLKMQVIPKGEGSLVKYTIQYEKGNEHGPDPQQFMNMFAMCFDKLDAHLVGEA
ncbi:Mlp-like protein [Thalictrum thalictroides]|uniref:Mlp-like protein n=1 Tax=Thalictrum thalictroides TaxID=46969 RepID=A0A7J6WCZ7_THATH|nr:Mlp-like protein [Thalictrum thalictroides]